MLTIAPDRPVSTAIPAPAPRASVRNLPVNLFASVMSLAGLSLAWRLATPAFGAPAVVGEAFGALAVAVFAVLALAYLAKLARHADAVRAEFAHPVAGNFFGTIAISVLLLAVVVLPYSEALGEAVWALGVLATFTLAFVVAGRLLRGGNEPAHAVPAMLVPGVAALDIAVTGAHMPMAWAAEANLAALGVGGVMALVLYTMIVPRLAQQAPLARPLTPSLMILVAPFAVGFLAYTNVIGEVDRFAAALFYFGLFIFLAAAPKVFQRDIPFGPGWWAIGFPMAALGNAALKYAAARPGWPLHAVAGALLAALTVAVAVLSVRTVRIALNGRLLSA